MDYRRIVNQVVVGVAVAVLAAAPADGEPCEQKLLASDGAADDGFGCSVSVSGDVAVVGAQNDDDNGTDSGSAYVYRWDGSSWVQEQKLLASDGAADDDFGFSVSVSGDVAVVGAANYYGTSSGWAYVYRWNGSSWVQEHKLLASDGAAADQFGRSVSVSGDVAVVGADKDNDNGQDSGSAYVFRWNGSSWVQEQKLLASDGAMKDFFGLSVSVSGDVAVVGAHSNDDHGPSSGSAYVYRWNGSSWVQEQKLLPSDAGMDDFFGFSVSVSGDVVVGGAGGGGGSARVYRWNGSSWAYEQKLLSDGPAGDYFGWSVSVSGDVAVVGAREWGMGGVGYAYVFRWNGSSWVRGQKLLASDGAFEDYFGASVSVSGGVAVVGAHRNDDNGTDSGSAYVLYCQPPCPWDIAGPGGGPPDGTVGINDFLELLATWGCVDCPADFLDPPGVDLEDCQYLLDNWGAICPREQASQPPPLPEEIEGAGLTWPDDWDVFVDSITNGSPEEQDNCVCWLGHYLASGLWPDCPGDDPFASSSGPQVIPLDQPGANPSPGWTTRRRAHRNR